jgi:integrase
VTKSSVSRRQSKPKRPYLGFPLFPHANGSWAKKILGKFKYFGPWDNPEAALKKFNREWPYLSEGRTPSAADTGDGCTFRFLCNAFLNSKRTKLESDELSERSFRDYFKICERLIDHFGRDRRVDDLRPDDFEKFRSSMAKRFGVVTLKNEVNRCRVVFKYAHDNRLIEQAVNYGQSFNRPSAKHLRRARNEAGSKMFEVDEILSILNAADPIMRAMVLLGINCGFGNTDVATLPQSAVDLKNSWIDFPRPKTEIHRRVPLWPETVEALTEAIASRPKAKETDDENLCFLTHHRRRWVRVQASKKNPDVLMPLDAISQSFRKLLNSLDINGKRNFYAIRHTFETIGGESKDQVAVNAIMGHVDSLMAGVYRERISDERLTAVTDTVRAWLWPELDKPAESEATGDPSRPSDGSV